MEPQGWQNFLKQIATDYRLHGRLREIFLVRFSYENWRKPDKQVWQLAEAASHETYKKQMTAIYAAFSDGDQESCPELERSGKGPGKFNILREWLKDIKYPQWQQNSITTTASQPQSGSLFNYRTPIQFDSPFYIERHPIEADCCQEILQPGALIRIKAPEKMGKTSLLRRILAHAELHGCRTVYLNLHNAEAAVWGGLDKFLRWFCANVSRELGVSPKLDDYWAEELYGSLISCKTYFQTYLLPQLERPLVLGLDNVDRVFEYPEIAQDFLPMLRSWNEEANNYEVWQSLRLVIVHSTDSYIDLDANQSPFNVGWPVQLPGFTLEQAQALAQVYGFDWTQDPELQKSAVVLMKMVGGHPYLVHLALDALVRQEMTLADLIIQAPTQGGIYGSHLRYLWDALQTQPDLVAAMKQVVTAAVGVKLGPTLTYKLESMGLVTLKEDEVQPSCELYRQYFQARL
jgi:hypothetical protein